MNKPHLVSPRRCVAVIGTVMFLFFAGVTVSPDSASAAPHMVTRGEWAAYLRQNPALSLADKELNDIYRSLMKALPPEDKKDLLAEQRAWVARRDAAAAASHPKGSGEYLARLAEITAARCTELRHRQERGSEKHAASTPAPQAPPAVQPPVTLPVPAKTTGAVTAAIPDTIPRPELAAAPEKAAEPAPQAAPLTAVPEPAPIIKPRAQAPDKIPAAQTPPMPPHRSAMRETPPFQEKSPAQTLPPAQEKPAAVTPNAPVTDLNIALPNRKKPTPPPSQAQIDITPARFSRAYNSLAHSLKAAPFPLVPTNVSGNGTNRTEHYQIQDGISIQFKYTQSLFDKPEVVTFIGRQFMTGPAEYRDSIAGALVTLLKTLSEAARPETKASDEEIFGFMRTINQAFTSDASRVWKNSGLVYVITYMKKTDLFAMAISLDNRRPHKVR